MSTQNTRERLVGAATELFGRNGYHATGVKAVLADAQVQSASLYHFFPGGKEALGVAAIAAGAEHYLGLIVAVFDASPDPAAATEAFFAAAADVVELTGYGDACPIATVALETANASEPLRAACAAAFSIWIDELTRRYVAAGIASDAARLLAVRGFCLLEGAFVLARTWRATDAIRDAGRAIAAELRQATPQRARGR